MAGFMSKLSGYVYEGEFQALKDTKIGAIVSFGPITASADGKIDKRFDIAAIGNLKAMCVEVGYIYGDTKAARYIVTAVDAAKTGYLTEQNLTHYEEIEYDMPQDVVKAGGFLRAHPLAVGEEFWQSIETADPAVGTEYAVGANGYLA